MLQAYTQCVIAFSMIFLVCLTAEVVLSEARRRFRRGRRTEVTNLQLPTAMIEMLYVGRNPMSGAEAGSELETLPIMPRAPKVYSGGSVRHLPAATRRMAAARRARCATLALAALGVLMFIFLLERIAATVDVASSGISVMATAGGSHNVTRLR